jgi:hypothetical protein
MKKCILYFAMSAMILLMASCNTKEKKLIAHIPSDAVSAVAINVKTLIGKSGMPISNGTVKLPAELDSTFGNNVEEQTLKKSIESLPSSGIDFDSKAYLFFGSKIFRDGALFKVSDSKALLQFLTHTGKLKIGEGGSVQKYHYYIAACFVAVFNDDFIFCGDVRKNLSEAEVLHEVEKLFSLDKKDSYLADDDAVDALTSSDDVSIYFNYKAFKAAYLDQGEYKSMINASPFLTKLVNSDVSGLLCSINLNDKDITSTTKIIGDENSPLCKLLHDVIGQPDANCLKFIPKGIYAILAVSINGDALMKNPDFVHDLSQIPDNELLSAADAKKLISSLNGSIVFSFDYYLYDGASLMYGAVKSKDPKFLLGKVSAFVGRGSELSNLPNGEIGAMISDNDGIIYGVRDGYFYFRTSPDPVNKSAFTDPVVNKLFAGSAFANFVDFRSGSSFAKCSTDEKMQIFGSAKSGISGSTFNSDLVFERPVCKNTLQTLIKIISFYACEHHRYESMAVPDTVAVY